MSSFWSDYLKADWQWSSFVRCLEEIDTSLKSCEKAIDEAHSAGDPDFEEAVTDTECEVMESLWGIAFVLGQTYITAVVSGVKFLHAKASKAGKTFATPNAKAAILALGTAPISGTAHNAATAVNAFANYFKHRDEWPLDWAGADKQSQETIRIISDFGLVPASTGNLRTAASHFNCDVKSLARQLQDWRNAVWAQCERDGMLST